MPLNSKVKTVVEQKLEEYEGRYDHMYLDSKGKVTIGVGHLIANKNASGTLTLYTVKNKLPSTLATLKQKQDEYDAIAKQKKNYKASWYKQHTSLVMKDADINTQRNKHVTTFYNELSGMYTKAKGFATSFDDMPEGVQIALFNEAHKASQKSTIARPAKPQLVSKL